MVMITGDLITIIGTIITTGKTVDQYMHQAITITTQQVVTVVR